MLHKTTEWEDERQKSVSSLTVSTQFILLLLLLLFLRCRYYLTS